jgi:hypothetical protein
MSMWCEIIDLLRRYNQTVYIVIVADERGKILVTEVLYFL